MAHPEGAPPDRRRVLVDAPVRPQGSYVLYWMTSARRLRFNFGYDRARLLARELGVPVLILEALRCDYPWASDRFHRFVMDGMLDNQKSAAKGGVRYYPYLEPSLGAGKGLLSALAENACVVVGDDFPCFFLPRMHEAAAKQVKVRFELVDSNGLLPLSLAGKAFGRAVDFRRHLQRVLAPHLLVMPVAEPDRKSAALPLAKVSEAILNRWPPATVEDLQHGDLSAYPIDHTVGAVAGEVGGTGEAGRMLKRFLSDRLPQYAERRSYPEEDHSSELSAHLHFGHLSSHEIFMALARQESWDPGRVAPRASGSRAGFWGMSETAEAWLDQFLTWRELGYTFCHHESRYDQFETLPDWAKTTLDAHRRDPRPALYKLEQFEAAQTHDPLWNAAQNQLRRSGRMHNYLRMLWGKMVLHWSASPEQAFEWLIHLNNKYALDGRNPNSYSGIAWCFGRFDRPWGPTRPVFGTVRYMTSDSTRRKFPVGNYIKHWNGDSSAPLFP
jgi:deoxyribodipyrimidine photo-lyase